MATKIVATLSYYLSKLPIGQTAYQVNSHLTPDNGIIITLPPAIYLTLLSWALFVHEYFVFLSLKM